VGIGSAVDAACFERRSAPVEGRAKALIGKPRSTRAERLPVAHRFDVRAPTREEPTKINVDEAI